MNIDLAIIGAGLIGKKRALALPKEMRLSLICDVDEKRGLQFAKDFNCVYESNWKKVIANSNIQAVMICTTNNLLAPITIAAIREGKHVLSEKPGAITVSELKSILF